MIGKDEVHDEEETELKITDKRKFNVDGSLRDGVTIDTDVPQKKHRAQFAESGVIESEETAAHQHASLEAETPRETADIPLAEDDLAQEDLLDDDDPASFINFLSTLVTNAAASLGAMPHPATGQKTVDLDTGKYWIDVLAMLREKTAGNLKPQEQKLLESILSDLRMQFVSLTRATEEKLKAQAAQKFSSKDVLGG